MSIKMKIAAKQQATYFIIYVISETDMRCGQVLVLKT